LHKLADLCKELGLEEHIKVFPLGKKANMALMECPGAHGKYVRKYVSEMNKHPELFAKHLLPSEGHPATKFLPGLPGYAEFKALSREEYERVLSQRAQVKARKERVYVGIIMWKEANKTDWNPTGIQAIKDLNAYVTTTAFHELTRNHPAFADGKIVREDIWKYHRLHVTCPRELSAAEYKKKYALTTATEIN